MTEYPELFERIDQLDKEMDVQAALIEGLTDKVAYLLDVCVRLEATKATRRSKTREGGPSLPLLPGGSDAERSDRSD